MPTLVACLWRPVEALQPGRVPTHFGPATRLRRPKSQWNQEPLPTSQVEMCPQTANSGQPADALARAAAAHPLEPVEARQLDLEPERRAGSVVLVGLAVVGPRFHSPGVPVHRPAAPGRSVR